jgi:hypothetical protein
MTELETLLKNHDWSHAGYVTRTDVDQAMRVNAGVEATSLWEQYCPWSDTNGGYIAWSKK